MYTKAKTDLKIDAQGIQKAALLVRAVNHPVRQRMLKMMARCESIAVTTLSGKLKLSQAEVSMHLAVLRRLKVVSARREGKHRLYAVNRDYLQLLSRSIEKFIP